MRFIKTRFVGVTLLLAVAAGPVLGVAAKERKPIATAAAGVSTIAIDNFGRVSATYYRGAQPGDRDFVELAALGVKTVIDLQEDGLASEPGLVERAGMKYVRIPMTTHKAPDRATSWPSFLQLVNDPVESAGVRALRRRASSHGRDDGGVPDDQRRLDVGSGVQGDEAVPTSGPISCIRSSRGSSTPIGRSRRLPHRCRAS